MNGINVSVDGARNPTLPVGNLHRTSRSGPRQLWLQLAALVPRIRKSGGQPGPRGRVFFYVNFFLGFLPPKTLPDLTWSGPVRSLFTFCLDAKSNIKAPEKWRPSRAADAGLSFGRFLFVSAQETCAGPYLVRACPVFVLLFALMQKVTKKSRLQKNG